VEIIRRVGKKKTGEQGKSDTGYKKCFGCGRWGYIAKNCRAREEKKITTQ